MCHQTVSLVARHLEENGLPTLAMCSARDILAAANPPRAVFLNYPLGNTTGRPDDPENQRQVLRDALAAWPRFDKPGQIVDLPYRWIDGDDGWMERVFDKDYDKY